MISFEITIGILIFNCILVSFHSINILSEFQVSFHQVYLLKYKYDMYVFVNTSFHVIIQLRIVVSISYIVFKLHEIFTFKAMKIYFFMKIENLTFKLKYRKITICAFENIALYLKKVIL